MKTVGDLVGVAADVAKLAVKHGADGAEVVVRSGAELSVKVRMGQPELVQEAGSQALGLRVFRDKRSALTYTSDFSAAGIDRFVADSVEFARLAEPDEFNILPDTADYASSIPELDLWDDQVAKLSARDALDWCVRGEAAAQKYSAKVTNSEGATFSRGTGMSAFANSDGFAGGSRGSSVSFVVEPLCDDSDGKKRNGAWWTANRYYAALEDAESVGREAAKRTVEKLGGQKIPTGELTVVFDPEAGRGILRTLAGVISGGAIYRKSSYLVGREGSQVASPLVNIVDDPLIRRGLGSRPFDGDGLATRKNVVVENGILRTYLFDVYSARKLGRKSNGCASRSVGGAPHVSTSNFILQPGTMSKEELLSTVKRGLYVTEMMGFGFNAVTGDFSRGAGGFLIENGKLTQPVTEVTISANFNDLLGQIDAVANDLDMRSSTACPTFRVARMMLAGQ